MLELVVRLAQVGIEDQPPPHQENPLCLSHDKLKYIDSKTIQLRRIAPQGYVYGRSTVRRNLAKAAGVRTKSEVGFPPDPSSRHCPLFQLVRTKRHLRVFSIFLPFIEACQ